MKTVCLLYAMGDFVGMLWTGYHSLLTIASFWLALVVFHFLASHAQHKRALKRKHRQTVERVMREARGRRE
jgi:membrane protein implicated in regulation of membrane protease activity